MQTRTGNDEAISMKSEKLIKRILLFLVFLMPFAQGLYFYMELFGFMIIIVLLLGLVLAQKKKLVFHWPRGLFLLAFIPLSTATVFYGIDSFMSIIGTFKLVSYFLIYLLVQQLYEKEFKDQLLKVVVYSGLVMALLSLLLPSINLLSGFLIQGGRLGGFFQYANTFGLFLLLCFLLLLTGLYPVSYKFLGGALLMVAMMMTYSRGVLLLAFIGVLLLFILKVFEKGLLGLKKKPLLLRTDGQQTENRQLILMPVTLVFGVIIGLVIWRLLGQQELMNRMGEHFHSSEFLSRILYYQDGLDMIWRYPLGLGHLGYHYIQEAFQTGADYHVKFIHSNILQMTLDLGVAGGFLFLGFLLSIIMDKNLNWEYRLITGGIFIHGLIDFDFQFAYIWVVVILLTTRTLEDKPDPSWASFSIHVKHIGFRSLFAVTGILYLFFFFVTFLQYTNHYEMALAIAPKYTEARISYFRNVEDGLKIEIAKSLIENQDFFVDSFAYMRDYDYNNKDYERALELSRTCMRLNPVKMDHVERYSKILVDFAYHRYRTGEYAESLKLIHMIQGIPGYLADMKETHTTEFDIKHRVDFEMTKLLVEHQLNAHGLYNQIIQLEVEE